MRQNALILLVVASVVLMFIQAAVSVFYGSASWVARIGHIIITFLFFAVGFGAFQVGEFIWGVASVIMGCISGAILSSKPKR